MKYLLLENWPVIGTLGVLSSLIYTENNLFSIILCLILIIYIFLLAIYKAKALWICFVVLILLAGILRGYQFRKGDLAAEISTNHILVLQVIGTPTISKWNIQIPVKLLRVDNYASSVHLSRIRADIHIPEDKASILVKKTIKKNDVLVLRGDISLKPNKSYYYDIGLNIQNSFIIKPVRIFSILEADDFRLTEHIDNVFRRVSTDARSMLLPLLTGKREYMECPDRMLIQQSGLFHIFVISGFHIGLIAAILFFILNLFLSRNVSSPVVILLLFMYIREIQYPIAAVRAFIMIFIFLISYFLLRKPSMYFVLIFSIFIITIIYPADFFTLSFLMSILAVCGIIFSLQFIKGIGSGILLFDYFLKTWAISFFALLFISPLLISVFGYFSLWGIIVFPVVSFIVLLVMVISFIAILIPAGVFLSTAELLIKGFRLFLRDDIVSLFLLERNWEMANFLLIGIILYAFLIILYYILLREKSNLFILLFLIIPFFIMIDREDPRQHDIVLTPRFQNRAIFFDRRQGLLYKGNLTREDDRIIRAVLDNGNIRKLIMVVPVQNRLFSRISNYSRNCPDISLFIIDKGLDSKKNFYTYILLDKHNIPYKIIENSSKCIIYDFENNSFL